jgi:hypothetical protein
MLDRGMQEFADAMQARPRPPRRSSTRQAEQVDNLSAPGAQRLAQIIKTYWHAAGFTVATQIVPCTGTARSARRNPADVSVTRPRVRRTQPRLSAYANPASYSSASHMLLLRKRSRE